jgi:DNA ligase 1
MSKREFVPLAQIHDGRRAITGRFASVKLDGERAIWVPPTRGLVKENVPFANKPTTWSARDAGHVATGLWTRNGNIVHAPSEFLDRLPPFPIDVELWAGPRSFQYLRTIVSTFEPDSVLWQEVTACVLDAVDMRQFLAPSLINTRTCKICIGEDAYRWWCGQNCPAVPISYTFDQRHEWLQDQLKQNGQCILVEQIKLPDGPLAADELMLELYAAAIEEGGEGLVLHQPFSTYTCARTVDMLKIKPSLDAEGTVIGYIWGKEPDNRRSITGCAVGSRLGAMGGMVLRMDNGTVFTLSATGFRVDECLMSKIETGECAADDGFFNAGQPVDISVHNKLYQRGSRVTFTYRELSNEGVPKEARFLRAA